ncbi:PAAR domain-containing protein [Campylobacter coli]
MPAVARLGDIGSGHASFPETAIITAASKSFTNNIPRARQGDRLEDHGSPSPSPPHGRAIAEGSPNTFTENKPQAYIGHKVDCGGIIVTGSGNDVDN